MHQNEKIMFYFHARVDRIELSLQLNHNINMLWSAVHIPFPSSHRTLSLFTELYTGYVIWNRKQDYIPPLILADIDKSVRREYFSQVTEVSYVYRLGSR
jgi:hypothetical protein